MMGMMFIGLAILIAVVLVVIIARGAAHRPAVVASSESDKKKRQKPSVDTAAGIRDLLNEGRKDEAIELYAKFAGVDQYTAQDAVEAIEREMRLDDDVDEGDGYTDGDDETFSDSGLST